MSARAVLLRCALCIFAASASAEDFSAGRAKLAEMVAFIRHAAERCSSALVPDGQMWPMEALSLFALTKPPITETEVQAKGKEVEGYRVQLGEAKWCELYAVEMKQAHLIFGLAINRAK